MSDYPRFHLAIPVADLNEAKKFYTDILGCKVGRTAEKWVDIDFFGHQVSMHLCPEAAKPASANEVDGDDVPVRHFGIVAAWDDWHKIADKLRARNIKFIIEPHIRFQGKVGEQATMFFLDPSGNAIEIKAFQDIGQLFAA
ncbi:MAG: putative dioxygenase of extradiol dioxygenase family protein [Rickettsiaceae bacterium]|jgi:extradiol dioxygenase family protein|nr:putative dioxygenase of extradiol dioxygenase family protein [Rickettsiaceae bacterium]